MGFELALLIFWGFPRGTIAAPNVRRGTVEEKHPLFCSSSMETGCPNVPLRKTLNLLVNNVIIFQIKRWLVVLFFFEWKGGKCGRTGSHIQTIIIHNSSICCANKRCFTVAIHSQECIWIDQFIFNHLRHISNVFYKQIGPYFHSDGDIQHQ